MIFRRAYFDEDVSSAGFCVLFCFSFLNPNLKVLRASRWEHGRRQSLEVSKAPPRAARAGRGDVEVIGERALGFVFAYF